MQNISMSDAELLKFAIENGMLDTALVQERIEMQKRIELLKMHNYEIWQGTNGKWYTYLPDEEKGRVLKKRTSEKAIEDLIIKFYKENSENEKIKRESKSITLLKLYPKWLDYKQILTKKSYYNMSIILRQCLDYAVELGYNRLTNKETENRLEAISARKINVC